MNVAETRYLDVSSSEIRADEAGGRPLLRGVALRYGTLSAPMKDSKGRPFRERFSPGAFGRALSAGADVRALVNHDPSLILGRNKAGTLRLIDEPEALRFEVDPPDTEIARHYVSAVKRGDMSGMSFRFYKRRDSWSGAGDATIRDVAEADLDDVSIVTYPAYPDTEAAARSLDDYRREHPPRRDPWLIGAAMRLRLAESSLSLTKRRP